MMDSETDDNVERVMINEGGGKARREGERGR